MNKIWLLTFLILIIIPLVNAEQQTIGPFKTNQCISLIQSCANCTYVHFTSTLFPNSTELMGNVSATKTGSVYNYSICNASVIGSYIVNGMGDIEGKETIFAYTFEVNSIGYERDEGNFGMGVGVILIGITLLFVILAAVMRENRVWSIFFILFSFFMMVVDLRMASIITESASLNSNLAGNLNSIYGIFLYIFVFMLFMAALYILFLSVRAFTSKKSKAEMIRESLDTEIIFPGQGEYRR